MLALFLENEELCVCDFLSALEITLNPGPMDTGLHASVDRLHTPSTFAVDLERMIARAERAIRSRSAVVTHPWSLLPLLRLKQRFGRATGTA